MSSIPDERRQHLKIIGTIWTDVAPRIYAAYKREGRGVFVLFRVADFPFLKDMVPLPQPPGLKEGEGILGAYVPRKALILLEPLVGEKALLDLHRMAGAYNPEEEIVFVFLFKKDHQGVTSAYRVGNLGGKTPANLEKETTPAVIHLN
ncbi:MAG: hypothetical protein R6U57_13210 [Anaerolineales bacterium]